MALNIFDPAPASTTGFTFTQFNRLAYAKQPLEILPEMTAVPPVIPEGSLLDNAVEYLLKNWPEGRPFVLFLGSSVRNRIIVDPQIYKLYEEELEPGQMPTIWTLDRLTPFWEALGWDFVKRGLLCELRSTNPIPSHLTVWHATEDQRDAIAALEKFGLGESRTKAYRTFLAEVSWQKWQPVNPSADEGARALARKQLFFDTPSEEI